MLQVKTEQGVHGKGEVHITLHFLKTQTLFFCIKIVMDFVVLYI